MNPFFSKIRLLFSLTLLSACTVSPTSIFSSQNPDKNVGETSKIWDDHHISAEARQAMWAKIQAKKAYLGPINIHLNQNLLDKNTIAQTQNLTSILNNSDFHTQSLPNGNIVFQETFVSSGQVDEIRRAFQISDSSQRYIIHLKRLGQFSQTRAYLNGNKTFTENDFNQTSEAQSPGILLNASNSLLLHYQGEPGASITLTVVQAGQAGTILRHQGGLGLPSETQATHLNQADSTIFNPYVPDSLGTLKPYQGDLDIPASGSYPELRISAMKFNELPPLRFETGALILKFADPQVGLELMRNHYGAEVVQETDGFYTLRFNLSTAPVNKIVELVHYFNQHSDGNVERLAFSSLASMQTYAIGLDILQRFPGLLTSFDFNEIGEPSASFNDSVLEHAQGKTGPPPQNADLGVDITIRDCAGVPATSWWLTQTHADRAWDLSIGTGVKVAWLDMGYTFPSNLDLEARRLKFGLGARNVNESHTNPTAEAKQAVAGKYHSLYSMLTGFGERDNGVGMVGYAPNATVVPYRVYSSGDFAEAIKQARQNNIPVIGINYGWRQSNPGQAFFYNILEWLSFGGDSSIRNQVVFALTENRSVIMSAHNYHESIEGWNIIDLTQDSQKNSLYFHQSIYDSLIVVGSVMPIQPTGVSQSTCPPPATGQLQVYASYANYNLGQEGEGSDYGERMVWAPGDQIYLQNVFGNSNAPLYDRFNGTSAATPLVTAVVAQIRSRNPNLTTLTAKDIKDILLSSRAQKIIPNPHMVAAGTSPAYLLDVEKALSDPRIWGRSGETSVAPKKAQEFYGFVTADKKIKLNTSVLNSSPPEQKERQLGQTMAQTVWDNTLRAGNVVKVSGWSSIQAGDEFFGADRIEVLQAQKVCDSSVSGNCTNIVGEFKPQINKITFDPSSPSSAAGFNMTFEGKNLIANLQNPSANFVLNFQPYDPSTGNYITGSTQQHLSIPSTDILEISNDATRVKIKIAPNKIPGGTGGAKITYEFSLSGIGSSALVRKNSDGKDFGIQADGFGNVQQGYQILSSEVPVYQSVTIPAAPEKWIVRDTRKLPVNPDAYIGIGIDARLLGVIEVQVDGKPMLLKEVADHYLTGTLPADLEPGVKDVIIKLAGGTVTLEEALEIFSLPRLQEVQTIPATGATRFASFKINNDTYLAVTNSYDEPPPRTDLSTELYKWNGNQFTPFQSIPANSPDAVEAFTIGNDHFLAIAEYYHGQYSTFDFNSHILKWDGTHFAPFQEILTHGAAGWKHFVMDGQDYLIVSNHATGSGGYIVSVQVDSVLYKWNGAQFEAVQNIPTTAARDWEYLEVGDKRFLAVANEYDGFSYNTSTNINSEIFQWDGSKFNSFQKIHSEGARDWKAFNIGDRHFLALGNLAGSTHSPSTAEKAKVYEWTGTQFTEAQSFDDSYVMSWDKASLNGKEYLLTAGDNLGAFLYHWNGLQWNLIQNLQMPGTYDGIFFTLDGDQYFGALSIYYQNNSYHAGAKIFKLE